MIDLDIKIPDGFLEEEVRCDYLVTKQKKEIWAIELDLYQKLRKVCDKYGLRLAANAGTALGAARHKGFIPWDDDLDFMMPRKDYDKLCTIAKQEFKAPYFFENYYSDPHFVYGNAKLVNETTTGYENPYLTHHGIFIDIFPLDNIPDDKKLYDRQFDRAMSLFRQYQRIGSCSKSGYYKEKDIAFPRRAVRFLYYLKFTIEHEGTGGRKQVSLFRQFEDVCKKYNNLDTQYIGGTAYLFKKDLIFKNDFFDLIDMEFEFTKIPMIKHYNEYLTRVYGDWHKFVKSGIACHTFKIVDTDRPYTEVLKEKGIVR